MQKNLSKYLADNHKVVGLKSDGLAAIRKRQLGEPKCAFIMVPDKANPIQGRRNATMHRKEHAIRLVAYSAAG